MNSETKRHIDAARQVLVGVVPNPASQIDQITYALIYKFMDDMDQSAIKNGDDPNFFIEDLEDYSWSRLMDTKIGNQERMNLYVVAFQKFAEAKQLPELFRNILKSAFLPYRSPETLGLFLKEIDYFDYSHPEELGNAYEYLLSIMSSQGDAGQFRTPRHIIDFIVDVVNPKKEDKVLDPACGTGGFLVSSYKHILEQHDGKNDPNKKEKSLTPDQRRNLMNNFEGYDIDPTMVRIAQVNMYLHQFKNPKIFQYDSLSSDERWNDKFDVVLANPPFMSPKGGIKPHNKFSIQSSRSEVLFVDYIMNHLRPNGRAGIIVPEGIIFQSGGAHKQLRKNMIEDGLYAVVSLPSGVFNPYSGVKTSILFFDNEISKKVKHILFVKIFSDGFDLGAQRRISISNDIPLAVEAINKYQKHVKENRKLSIGGWPEEGENIDTYPNIQFVSKEEISKAGEYNLSADRYRVAVDYSNNKWPMIELGEICTLQRGLTYSSNELSVENNGVPFYNLKSIKRESNNSQNDFKYFSGEIKDKHFVSKNDLLIALTDLTPTSELIGTPKLITSNEKAAYSADLAKVVFTNDKINVSYLYYLLRSNNYRNFIVSYSHGANVKHLQTDGFYKYKIPLLPLETQKQIVSELNGYQNIISGAKQIVMNWKPKIEIDPEWVRVKINEICKIERGASPRPIDKFMTEGPNGFNWVKIGDTKNADKYITQTAEKVTKAGAEKSRKVCVGDFVLSNSMSFGRPYIMKIEGYIHDGWLRLSEDAKRIGKDYLYYILGSDIVIEQFENAATGGVVRNLNSELVRNVTIPLPPLEIQKQIVEKIEAERLLIESAKKLIAIYEEKTKDSIDKLWSE